MDWEIFYTDGATVDSNLTSPFDIHHREDVQVIIQSSPDHNWVTLAGCDYYVWDDRGRGPKWWRVNDRSGLDHYLRQPGPKAVLFGTWIEPEDFNAVFEAALDKWGSKEAFTRHERHPEP
jgi:hypothetical protein